MAIQFLTSANTIDTGYLPGPFASITGTVTVGTGDGVFGINTIHTAGSADVFTCGRVAITPGDGSTGFTIGFGFTPLTTNSAVFLTLGNEGGLTLNSNGSLTATGASGSGSSFGSAAGVINIGQRNYVEFECPEWNNTGGAVCNVYVGGVKVATGTLGSFIGNPLFGSSPLTAVVLGNVVGGAIFDSIYVLDTTTSVNNAPLGPQVVGLLRPRAPGTKAQWTPNGAATDWEAVNNIPPDGDTIYISDSTAGDECSVELTTPSIYASISAVSVVVDSREDVAAGRTIKAGVGNGTTQSYGGSIALATTYAMNTQPFNENPSTSAAWTLGDILTLQAAVKLAT